MLDLKFVRENPDLVKENMEKKFQHHKLHLVDEVICNDAALRRTQQQADELRSKRKSNSKKIGMLMGQGKKEEAEAAKLETAALGDQIEELSKKKKNCASRYRRHDADSKYD